MHCIGVDGYSFEFFEVGVFSGMEMGIGLSAEAFNLLKCLVEKVSWKFLEISF